MQYIPQQQQPTTIAAPPPPGNAWPPGNALPWVVLRPSRPTSQPLANYQHLQSKYLGVALIVVAILSFIFNIVDLGVNIDGDYYKFPSLGFFGHGFWSGALCLTAGILGVIAGAKRTACLIRAFMTLCIIAASCCLGQFIVGVMGAVFTGYEMSDLYERCQLVQRSCEKYTVITTLVAMESLLAVMAIVGGCAAIWGSALACRAACCCSQYDMMNVENGAVQMVIVGQQQQQQGGPQIFYQGLSYAPPYQAGGMVQPGNQFLAAAPCYSLPSTALTSPYTAPAPTGPPALTTGPPAPTGSVSKQPASTPDYSN